MARLQDLALKVAERQAELDALTECCRAAEVDFNRRQNTAKDTLQNLDLQIAARKASLLSLSVKLQTVAGSRPAATQTFECEFDEFWTSEGDCGQCSGGHDSDDGGAVPYSSDADDAGQTANDKTLSGVKKRVYSVTMNQEYLVTGIRPPNNSLTSMRRPGKWPMKCSIS